MGSNSPGPQLGGEEEVVATETVEVGTQVSGIVKALYVDYNSRVRKGQVLALVDAGPYEVQLEEAKAALASARAAADAAKVSVQEAKDAVKAAVMTGFMLSRYRLCRVPKPRGVRRTSTSKGPSSSRRRGSARIRSRSVS